MAEEIIQARVWTKVDTLENWNNNPLLLGPGEMALVTTEDGIPLNMKWGDKTTRKRFSDLPFAIAYDQGQFVAVSGPGALPTPVNEVAYSLVGPGTYTFTGQPNIVVPDGRLSQLVWNGSTWSLIDMGELPSIDVSDLLPKDSIKYNSSSTDGDVIELFDGSSYTVGDALSNLTGMPTGSPSFSEAVYSGFIDISEYSELWLTKGADPIPTWNCFFYDSSFQFIAPAVSTSPVVETKVLKPSNAKYFRGNISSTASKRAGDISAFSVKAKKPSYVDTIEGVKVVSVGNQKIGDNIISYNNIVRNSYAWSNGVLDFGSATPKESYVRSDFEKLDPSQTKISYKRESNLGIPFVFYDKDKVFVSAITATPAKTGTVDIPALAIGGYVIANISNNPATRRLDVENFIAVYGDVIPTQYKRAYKFNSIINGERGLQLEAPYAGKVYVSNGDSIPAGVNAQNGVTTNIDYAFPSKVANKLGMTLHSYAISGSTVAVNPANPTGRNPLVNRISEMDSNADLVTIAIGTNDFNYSWSPFGDMSSTSIETFYGALKSCCEQLQVKYTGKRIIWLTPIKRAQSENPTPESVNAVGKRLVDYVDAIIEVCGYYGIEVLDNYRECILNPYLPIYASYFDSVKTHPLEIGHEIMADGLIRKIL